MSTSSGRADRARYTVQGAYGFWEIAGVEPAHSPGLSDASIPSPVRALTIRASWHWPRFATIICGPYRKAGGRAKAGLPLRE
jgi:hypothetical protein